MNSSLPRSSALYLFVLLSVFAACVPETSRSAIALPAFAIGDARDQWIAGDLEITILEAKIALGPIYFCASALPSDHVCESSRLELLEPFIIDLLDGEPREVGLAQGTSGRIASAQYNFGRSILAGEIVPITTGASVDGHSARFILSVEGPDERTLIIRITLDLDPARSGSLRVLGHNTEIELDESIASLRVSASAYELLSALDLSQLADAADDPDKAVGELELAPNDRLYEAIASRLSSGSFPRFEWAQR